MKKLTSILLALALVLALPVSAFAKDRNTATVTTAPQTYQYTRDNHPFVGNGPIAITKGTLIRNGTRKDIYFIALHGTETWALGSSLNLINDLQSGNEIEGAYYKEVLAAITRFCKKGSNLVIAGHSLGGMIAQQVAASDTLKDNYNILNIVAFGAPAISAGETEGELHRLCDTNDRIPYLSHYYFEDDMDTVNGTGRSEETWPGDEDGDTGDAHVFSYKDENTWGDYDAVGVKGGNAKLILEENTTIYVDAPLIDGTETHFKAWAAYQDEDGEWTGIAIEF